MLSQFTDLRMRRRDTEFEDFIAERDLTVENNGRHTCTYQGRNTVNDYTLTINTAVNDWKVLEAETLSDHEYNNV